MSKSKNKVSKKFNTLIRINGGDRFSRLYAIKSVEDSNQAGQEYYNLSVRALGFVPEDIFHAAEKMYESVSEGVKNVSRNR